MTNPLANLSLDYWYKAIMVVCAIIFILCGTGVLRVFPVGATAALSAGGFFVGLGEWVNHPLHSGIIPATFATPASITLRICVKIALPVLPSS